MGAEQFSQRGKGATAEAAFQAAVAQACYEHGHGGYSGTLAEKSEFVMIDVPEEYKLLPQKYADTLLDEGDDRIDDKWGPAGCIVLDNNEYLFFGWASC